MSNVGRHVILTFRTASSPGAQKLLPTQQPAIFLSFDLLALRQIRTYKLPFGNDRK